MILLGTVTAINGSGYLLNPLDGTSILDISAKGHLGFVVQAPVYTNPLNTLNTPIMV